MLVYQSIDSYSGVKRSHRSLFFDPKKESFKSSKVILEKRLPSISARYGASNALNALESTNRYGRSMERRKNG